MTRPKNRGLVWLAALALLGACGDAANAPSAPGAPDAGATVAAPTEGAIEAARAPLRTDAFAAREPRFAPRPGPITGTVRPAYGYVHAEADADIVRTTVTEVLVNDGDIEASASFTFSLPRDATITGFAQWIEGRRVEATLETREAAREALEEATARGERAALAETSGRRFRMALSPIAGGGERRVELRYVQTLERLAGERRWILPAQRDTAPPSGLDIELRARARGLVRTIAVPNQRDAHITQEGDAMSVRLSRTGAALGEDLLVAWTERTEPIELSARAVAGSDTPGYAEAVLAFHEDMRADEAAPRDVVMVIDASLSMAGEPLASSQSLARQVVSLLGPNDRLALVTFDDEIRAWPALVPADDAARDRALAEVQSLRPRSGSTVPAAIDAGAALLAGSERGLLLIATDGQATEGDDLDALDLATRPEDLAAHRLVVAHFNYPSRAEALESLAEHTEVHFVPSGRAAASTVRSLARLAVAPAIEDLEIAVEGLDAETLHGHERARLALGEQLRLTGRIAGEVRVTVTGTLHGTPISLVASPEAERVEDADAIAQHPAALMWARAEVDALEAQYRADRSDALRERIVALGRAHRIATRFTSFVSVDRLYPDRIRPGDPEIRIHAPADALGVFAILPWGEEVRCTFEATEGAWLGRFLVPRGFPEGLYRARVFVVGQSGPEFRSTLLFRVDGAAPRFEVEARHDGDHVLITATPARAVFEPAASGDVIVPDRVDLRYVRARIGSEVVTLTRAEGEEVWRGTLPAPESGRHTVVLVATDYAENSSRAETTVEVSR